MRTPKASLSTVMAVLVLTAALPLGAIVAAQTTTYAETITDSPDRAVVQHGDMSGEFEVEVVTSDVPSGEETVLHRDTYDTGNLAYNYLVFNNQGAHDSIELRVRPADGGTGEPGFGDGSILSAVDRVDTMAGSGGDRDLTCDHAERIGTLTMPSVQVVDCVALPGSTTVNLTETDATQLRQDLYQGALNTEAASENTFTALSNNLEDASTIARIKGKNAYIRSLNNGTSETAARSEAKSAVSDYYATLQRTLINTWNVAVLQHQYSANVAENESLDGMTVYINHTGGNDDESFMDWRTTSQTLINGETETGVMEPYDPSNDNVASVTGSGTLSGNIVRVASPDGINQGYATLYDAKEYGAHWSEIESQNDAVQGEMDTLVNNTYEEYQNGEINNSDLVDPYVLASEYSPGDDYQSWAAAQLTLLGTNSPEAFDSIGSFEISTESQGNLTGILMSQSNPASGGFSKGSTYDPSAIDGTQYVVTDDDIEELESNFTIHSITDKSGESRENVTIVEKHYETTNTTELKQMYEDLAYWRAQAEAREKAVGIGDGSGDGPPGGLSEWHIWGIGIGVAVVLLIKN